MNEDKPFFEGNDLLIYPNPASDYLIIHPSPDVKLISYVLYDSHGRVILEGKGQERENFRLNLSGIDVGTYYLSCQSKEKKHFNKLLIISN